MRIVFLSSDCPFRFEACDKGEHEKAEYAKNAIQSNRTSSLNKARGMRKEPSEKQIRNQEKQTRKAKRAGNSCPLSYVQVRNGC
jgi:hypothetical protein